MPEPAATSQKAATAYVFRPGEDWVLRLRDIRRQGGTAEVIRALDDWLASLSRAPGEPSRSSLLLGKAFAEEALGRGADAARTLEEAVASMEPEPGALRVVWEHGTPWPTLRTLIPMHSSGANALRGGSTVRSVWCQDVGVLSWKSPEETYGRWLLDLSRDASRPEAALAAATVWHLLTFTGDLHAGPGASPAISWREEASPRGEAARNAWSVEARVHPRSRANLDLRASLRAQVLDGFPDVRSERAERIRAVARRLLEPPPDPQQEPR